jgi:branched-chain amino acid transport system substrate-binding protein
MRKFGALISECNASTTKVGSGHQKGEESMAKTSSGSLAKPLISFTAAILTSAGIAGWPMAAAQAQAPKPVEIALILPLSGPWARQGQLEKLGAEMAIDEINAAGGIKSMGGAKLELISLDAGDSAEKAKNAAQRLIAEHPDVVGGLGAWLSTFTLAITEVTERAQIPWLTLSYADSITNRGFKYVFQTSPTADTQSTEALPTLLDLAKAATGKAPKTIGMIGDNTASPVAFLKPFREPGGLDKYGMKPVVDETFTPPLSDATTLMQKVRSARPELLLYVTSTISDLKLGLDKMNEFHIGKGAIPTIGNGGANGAPEVLKSVPPDLLEGFIFTVANWGLTGQEQIIDAFKKRTGEPWMTQDALDGYGHVWILKDAIEKVGSADKVKVAEAIHTTEFNSGPTAMAFPGKVKFDAAGHRVDAPLVMVQWQNGVPVTVYPTDRATAKPKWPKS